MDNIDYKNYDLAVSRTCANLLSYAKRHDNEIRLNDFNPKNPNHMYLFEVARLVSGVNGEVLTVDMPFWKHLFSEKKIRKTKRKHSPDGINIVEFLSFTFSGLEVTPTQIWEEYYR